MADNPCVEKAMEELREVAQNMRPRIDRAVSEARALAAGRRILEHIEYGSDGPALVRTQELIEGLQNEGFLEGDRTFGDVLSEALGAVGLADGDAHDRVATLTQGHDRLMEMLPEDSASEH